MLRDLLSSGGVAVPKGTKSSVLTEAANYIRVLQQHRFNSEIDRQNLVQEIRRMNSGQMGVKAQVAVRQVRKKGGEGKGNGDELFHINENSNHILMRTVEQTSSNTPHNRPS